MQEIRIKIVDLYGFGNIEEPPSSPSVEAISALITEHLSFLPAPQNIQIDGEEVILSFKDGNTTKEEEGKRLALKAARRAEEGDYDKAIGILKRAIELYPLLHSARRDLAMAYVEVGDADNAVNHLIEILRIDPKDTWSWVVLANLYIREKSDLDTGEQFLKRALAINPNDGWALNSLGAMNVEKGNLDKAVEIFDKSIDANPDFANPYYGKAFATSQMGKSEEALEILEDLFNQAKKQDARSEPVYQQSRALFVTIEGELAEQNQLIANATVTNYSSQMEILSGFPIRVEQADFEDMIGATIQMAWKHGRDHHLLRTRRGYPPPLLPHVEAHELTHVKLEAEARASRKNKFFTTTANSREIAIRSFGSDLLRLKKEGYSDASISKVTSSLIGGLSGFLFNCPLDMLIERNLRSNFPELRHSQFLSVRLMAEEARKTNENPAIRKLTPKKIMQASLALNGAYGLFLDQLFNGVTEFARPYAKEDTFSRSQRLYEHWISKSNNLGPGDEYNLVDDFADIIGLKDWYEWKIDPMVYERASEEQPSLVTNEELLKAKSSASIFYLLGTIKRYDSLPIDKVRDIGFEIALLGTQGLDFTTSDKRYNLHALPGEKFTGLQLMCLMYAAFKKFAPEQDVGIDLDGEYRAALKLYDSDASN